jgi:hypothetical protein
MQQYKNSLIVLSILLSLLSELLFLIEKKNKIVFFLMYLVGWIGLGFSLSMLRNPVYVLVTQIISIIVINLSTYGIREFVQYKEHSKTNWNRIAPCILYSLAWICFAFTVVRRHPASLYFMIVSTILLVAAAITSTFDSPVLAFVMDVIGWIIYGYINISLIK